MKNEITKSNIEAFASEQAARREDVRIEESPCGISLHTEGGESLEVIVTEGRSIAMHLDSKLCQGRRTHKVGDIFGAFRIIDGFLNLMV